MDSRNRHLDEADAQRDGPDDDQVVAGDLAHAVDAPWKTN
jgi:hypothetical protein